MCEERFTSLCYAGHLPGYAMNYNHHGLIFSINTLSANTLYSGKTRKLFINSKTKQKKKQQTLSVDNLSNFLNL